MKRIVLAFTLIVNCSSLSVIATTRNVPSQYSTIQAAINASVAGDEVVIAAGTYTGRLAGRLGIEAGSPERQDLDSALTELRKRGLLHYEFDRLADSQIRWSITAKGMRALAD